jgi:hypothetical protein
MLHLDVSKVDQDIAYEDARGKQEGARTVPARSLAAWAMSRGTRDI